MLTSGPAKKVTIYVDDVAQYHGEPLYLALLHFLFYRGVAGATVTRGMAGFGSHHQLHRAGILEISDHLPVKIEFVEAQGRLDAILPKLVQMTSGGLIDVQDTTVVKPPAGGETAGAPPVAVLRGRAKLVRIYIGEDDKWHGKALYQAIVESLRSNDIAGATVYRGIYGYGAHRRFQRDKKLLMSRDAPIMLSIIDEEEKIRAWLPVLEQMVQEGLVVLSDVEVLKYTHRAPGGQEATS
jgi:uncharacterized protein